MIDLKNNFRLVEERIKKACLTAGRAPEEVSLLPVSKTKSFTLIEESFKFGYKRFGENKAQEIEQKDIEISNEEINFCLIGHLQTNKVNKIVKHVSEIHSLDSLKLAVALEKSLQKQGRSIDALIQVNTSNEAQKFGLEIDKVLSFVKEIHDFSSIRVKGLMTLALNSPDESLIRPCFIKLRNLRDRLRQEGLNNCDWDILSMGMSKDLEIAIEEGSTEVRIGTDLFGSRS